MGKKKVEFVSEQSQNNSSLFFTQRPGHKAHNCEMPYLFGAPRSSQNESFNWLKKQVEMNYTNNAHIPKKILGQFFMQGRWKSFWVRDSWL